jgi:hypothetical protein
MSKSADPMVPDRIQCVNTAEPVGQRCARDDLFYAPFMMSRSRGGAGG